MNRAQKLLAVGGVTTLLSVGTLAGVASAQTGNGTNGTDSLVDKIAQRFNLNKDDVQKVFDENRSQHEADRQKRIEDRLNQAVKDGKITSAQKDAIIAKMKDMQTFMDSVKDKSADERRTLMKQKIDEMQQWAKDNNLMQYMPMMGGPGHHGMGMMKFNMKSDDNQSPESTAN